MPTRSPRFVAALLCALLVVAGYAGFVGVRVVVGGYCLEDYVPFDLARTRLEPRPYVQDVTTTSAALLWWTSRPTEATVRFGIAPGLTETRQAVSGRRHEGVLDGLQPDTSYVYEVTKDGDAPVGGTVRTAPDASATVTFGVF